MRSREEFVRVGEAVDCGFPSSCPIGSATSMGLVVGRLLQPAKNDHNPKMSSHSQGNRRDKERRVFMVAPEGSCWAIFLKP